MSSPYYESGPPDPKPDTDYQPRADHPTRYGGAARYTGAYPDLYAAIFSEPRTDADRAALLRALYANPYAD